MDTIDLDITETNELTFKVQIEGADNVPANIRLVCEAGDMSYMFRAHQTREIDTFDFIVPTMKSKIKEGVYRARVEVLLENKYFTPVEFELNFKQPVKVMAEAVVRQPEPQRVEPKVAISAVQVKKPSVTESEAPGARTPGIPGKTLREKYASKKS
jgi:hypothetical protein